MNNAEIKNDIIVKEYRWNWDIVKGGIRELQRHLPKYLKLERVLISHFTTTPVSEIKRWRVFMKKSELMGVFARQEIWRRRGNWKSI